MLFQKSKFRLSTEKGKGRIIASGMRGIIDHLIIIPKLLNVSYDFKILDEDGDEIYSLKNARGRTDCFNGLVVGKTVPEDLVVIVENSKRWFFFVKDNSFDLIFLIKER